MSDRNPALKVCNVILFVILMVIGLLYILAAPVNPVTASSRILTGTILIIAAIALLVIITLVLNRSKYKVEKTIVSETTKKAIPIAPDELICKNCGHAIDLTEDLKKRKKVICESCGEELKIPKDNINW